MSLQIPANTAYTIYYTDGMFLTAGEMTTAQSYFVNWIQLQNQLLYSPGVLSGLLVTNPSGNTLSVETGAGFDASGHFLILPDGTGTTLTVPANAANPSYVALVYPTTAQAQANMPPNTLNMAAILQLQNTNTAPQNGILLAQISMTGTGGISQVTDLRTPVKSLLPATLNPTVTLLATASQTQLNTAKEGTATFASAQLRKPGDTASQVITYLDPPTPAFSNNPRVIATAVGPLPYAVSVSEVGTTQFTLTLTVITAPAATNTDPVLVNWLALS